MKEIYRFLIEFIATNPIIFRTAIFYSISLIVASIIIIATRIFLKNKPSVSAFIVNPPIKNCPNKFVERDKNPISIEGIKTERIKTKQEKISPIVEHQNENTENKKTVFVNYDILEVEKTKSYPVFRFPKKGTVIRSYRLGKTKRRGFKEESFQKSIEVLFKNFEVLGNARLNTGEKTNPYEPDIVIIDKSNTTNLRIDIEIDEPYSGINRQPTHCIGEDVNRDLYFVDRGWIVIRFSEYQVHLQEKACLRFIAEMIKLAIPKYDIPNQLVNQPSLEIEKFWDVIQAQKWEKDKYRETYLNHIFKPIEEPTYPIEKRLNKQEKEEEKWVNTTKIGKVEEIIYEGFNRKNKHPRDSRIKFFPEPHTYTIDNISAPSVSTIIAKFFPEFDTIYWSRIKAIEKLKATNQDLSESNIQRMADIIAKEWKDKGEKAAQEGTFLHEQIEKLYLGQEYEKTLEFHLFEQFYNDHKNLNPHRTEWRVFDEEYHIAGTIDLIAKNGIGYDLYDWKRSKKIINSFTGEPIKYDQWGKKGIGYLSDIDDTSYNRYCLQQSLYKYIIEKNYGLKVSKMYLIVLHPEYDEYYKEEVPYLKNKAEYILKASKA